MNKIKQINIFIVEDNKVFALLLKSDIESAFEEMAIKVHLFETGEACIKKIKELKPQVVILDYHLDSKYPDAANGIEVLDWIKSENPDTNVIMLTNEDNIMIASMTLKHGAFDYVVKTETTFKKINYSLANIFKITDAKMETKKYKKYLLSFLLFIALLAGAVITVHILLPSFFKNW